MTNDLTKCKRCGQVLVHHEEIHAVRGDLYCSKSCAIDDIMDDYIMNAKELAIEAYDSEAEVVSSADILAEDLQEVKITLTCTKIIKLPRNLSEYDALREAYDLWNQGVVAIDADECDDYHVVCELVKNDNSTHDKEVK